MYNKEMEQIAFELSILRRCVAFKNLTWAAQHVGLSQPQISRIIKKIETHVGFPLLDRSSKRTACWLPEALRLAEIHAQSVQNFERELQSLKVTGIPTSLKIGLLEGMMISLMSLIENLSRELQLQHIEICVFDLSELEEKFFRSEIDLLFSSQEPGKRKFENSLLIGYQNLDSHNKNDKDKVMSPFEYATRNSSTNTLRKKSVKESVGLLPQQKGKTAPTGRMIISNSLEWRRLWIEKYKGHGYLPSSIHQKKSDGAIPVIALGADYPWMPLLFEKLQSRVKSDLR